jgi:hypothetical protein
MLNVSPSECTSPPALVILVRRHSPECMLSADRQIPRSRIRAAGWSSSAPGQMLSMVLADAALARDCRRGAVHRWRLVLAVASSDREVAAWKRCQPARLHLRPPPATKPARFSSPPPLWLSGTCCIYRQRQARSVTRVCLPQVTRLSRIFGSDTIDPNYQTWTIRSSIDPSRVRRAYTNHRLTRLWNLKAHELLRTNKSLEQKEQARTIKIYRVA